MDMGYERTDLDTRDEDEAFDRDEYPTDSADIDALAVNRPIIAEIDWRLDSRIRWVVAHQAWDRSFVLQNFAARAIFDNPPLRLRRHQLVQRFRPSDGCNLRNRVHLSTNLLSDTTQFEQANPSIHRRPFTTNLVLAVPPRQRSSSSCLRLVHPIHPKHFQLQRLRTKANPPQPRSSTTPSAATGAAPSLTSKRVSDDE